MFGAEALESTRPPTDKQRRLAGELCSALGVSLATTEAEYFSYKEGEPHRFDYHLFVQWLREHWLETRYGESQSEL